MANDVQHATASNSWLQTCLRILFAATRGFALLLGAFTLLNVLGELRSTGFDANLWWIDLRFANRQLSQLLMASSGVGLVGFAIRPGWAPFRGWLLTALVGLLMVVAAKNTWAFLRLVSDGSIRSHFPIPLSGAFFLLLATILWAIRMRQHIPPARLLDRSILLLALVAGLVMFPVAQMHCFGLTDYRRPADLIVVFGCRVFPDDVPSMALSDHVTTGVELFHQGLAPLILFSGGPGEGTIHETEAMRRIAVRLGVPESAIETDLQGLNTQATVHNLVRSRGERVRVLAVSHFYHLPRIKLCFRRAGWEVWTVPAHETRRLYYNERFILREVVAWWWYYLNPD